MGCCPHKSIEAPLPSSKHKPSNHWSGSVVLPVDSRNVLHFAIQEMDAMTDREQTWPTRGRDGVRETESRALGVEGLVVD
jgi:hypothetical protein